MNQSSAFPRERFRALLPFTSAFATLVESGVSLIRCLRVLREHAPSPYGEWAEEAQPPLLDNLTLSQIMTRRPDLFSPFYIAMIRLGEVGGILDETLRILDNTLATEWRLLRRAPGEGGPQSLLIPTQQQATASWEDLGRGQQHLILMLFCRCLGALLGAGVPAKLAVESVAELLPSGARDAVRAIPAAEVEAGIAVSLWKTGLVPPLVVHMVTIGEECGSLPRMLEKAAEVYQFEIEYEQQ